MAYEKRSSIIMSKKKGVSVKFIAEKCGVSTATVSRVLNDDNKVAEDTRKLVLEAFETYQYQPPERLNFHQKKIGVIINVNTEDYYASLLQEITKYMLKWDYITISCSLSREQISLKTALEVLYSSEVSGIIMIGNEYERIKPYLQKSIAHVWIDCNDELPATKEICTVQSDHYTAGRLAAQALLGQKRTKPLLLTNARNSVRNRERTNGFFQVFKEAGILLHSENVVMLDANKDGFTEAQAYIRYAIAKGMDFDSLFVISDWRALGAYTGAVSMGKRVPEDICIIGFDGISLACKCVNITCIHQDTEKMAQRACEQLHTLMEGNPVEEKHVIIPTDLLPGQTLSHLSGI